MTQYEKNSQIVHTSSTCPFAFKRKQLEFQTKITRFYPTAECVPYAGQTTFEQNRTLSRKKVIRHATETKQILVHDSCREPLPYKPKKKSFQNKYG